MKSRMIACIKQCSGEWNRYVEDFVPHKKYQYDYEESDIIRENIMVFGKRFWVSVPTECFLIGQDYYP